MGMKDHPALIVGRHILIGLVMIKQNDVVVMGNAGYLFRELFRARTIHINWDPLQIALQQHPQRTWTLYLIG